MVQSTTQKFAALGAVALLALQITCGLSYMASAPSDVKASMVGAMITVALLPLFIEDARRKGAYVIALSLGLAFVSLLVYSTPATIGRTGETKAAKVIAAQDQEAVRNELKGIVQTLSYARPEQAAECTGAPDPLPPNGWPKCRRMTGTVTALSERQARLEAQLSASGPAMGDLGSASVAWLLSPLGVGEESVRRLGPIGWGFGLEFVIWGLVAFATSHRIGGVPAIERRAPKPMPGPSFEPVLTPREQVIEWVQGYRDANGRDPTFTEVREAWKLPKASASRYRKEALEMA